MWNLLIIVLFSFMLAYLYLIKGNSSKDQPPVLYSKFGECKVQYASKGPRGLPILGHLLSLGPNPALTMMEWSRTFGPIFSLRFASFPVVVLNDLKLIKETFNLKALAGRPLLKTWEEMCQLKGLVLNDGPRQTEQRNFAIKTLNKFGVSKQSQDTLTQEEICTFLDDLKKELQREETINGRGKVKKLIKPHHFFQIPVINCAWSALIGERFAQGDPSVKRIISLIKACSDTNSSILVKLSYFFSFWSTFLCFFGVHPAVNSCRSIHKFLETRIQASRADYVPDEPKNFTHAYFDQMAKARDIQSSFHVTANEQPVTTGDIFNGALETTTTSLDWLLLLMAREPEVQRKLHEEIDTVLGKYELNNPPSLAHKTKMPYTEAVIQELLRVSSVLPLGVYHRTMEDIEIKGYKIPKNTMVIANQFAIDRNPDVWPEPNKFIPERFLNNNGKEGATDEKLASNLIPFGCGKRVCIGEAFARDQLFLFCASFFQRYRVSCTENIPSLDGNGGIFWAPKPFEFFLEER